MNPIRDEWTSADGQHRILLGDCLAVLPLLDTSEVAAVLADPPYEITAGGGGELGHREYMARTKGFTDGGFDDSVLDGFDNWACFCTLKQVPKLIKRAGNRRWMLVTWCKPDPTPLCGNNYLPDVEYIVHAWRKGCLFGTCKTKSRFIYRPSMKTKDGHPNEKPLDVVKKIVLNASDKGSLILDPFAGSCTVAVACARTGRRSISIEIEERYYRIGIERMEREAARHPLFEPPKPKQLDLLSSIPS